MNGVQAMPTFVPGHHDRVLTSKDTNVNRLFILKAHVKI